jgi:hypothetical protein
VNDKIEFFDLATQSDESVSKYDNIKIVAKKVARKLQQVPK